MKSVLIAEDDHSIRPMIITVLKPLNVRCIEARDGLEAVNLLRAQHIDAVVVDLMMPRLDGYTVIRYLEERMPSCRAVVISAVRAEELHELSHSPNVEAVLRKPFDVDELRAAVRAAVGE